MEGSFREVNVFGPLVATALLGCVASYYLGKAVERWSSQKGRADDRSAWAAELEEKQRDLLEAKKRLVRSDRLDAEDAECWGSLVPKCQGCGVIDWQWCDRDVESVDRTMSFLDTFIAAQGADYEYQ
jgi:hypothetical protein